MTPRSPQSHEFVSVRGALAALTLDIKLLKLQVALQRKHWSEQPRVPAGQHTGRQWLSPTDGVIAEQTVTDDDTRPRSNYQRTAETCQEYIAANCRAKINREFPKQFLDRDVSDLKAAA